MIATSKSSYRQHKYSGPRKSRRRVNAQLKRSNGADVSRADVWRKKSKIETPQAAEVAESLGQNTVKTYSKIVPVINVKPTVVDTKSQKLTKTKAKKINWPVIDPFICHDPNTDKNEINSPMTDPLSCNEFTNEKNEIKSPGTNPLSCDEFTNPKNEINSPKADPFSYDELIVEENQTSLPGIDPLSCNELANDKNEINTPPLPGNKMTNVNNVDNHLFGLTGNRIVDIQHVLRWAFTLEQHKQSCADSHIQSVGEIRTGFNSIFMFKCSMCGKEFRESNSKQSENLNSGFVWGTVIGGGCYTQAAHLTNAMDIPTMGPEKFRKIEKSVGGTWKDQLTVEIKVTGQQERTIAIEKGQLTDGGIPYLEVEVKRAANSDHNMACIIGKNTRKFLYIGIKDKYCYFCHSYEKDNRDVPAHKCLYKYQGSTTDMEADILVEGFRKSGQMHGVQYFSVNGGDSSIFAQLKKKVSYGKKIRKVENENHVTEKYPSEVYQMLAN